MSVGELISMYESDELNIRPQFQRFFRWTEYQRSRLIESLLLKIPIPSIFVSQRSDGVWDVIDGQQRLSTIFQLVGVLKDEDGKRLDPLKMTGTKFLPSLADKTWDGIGRDNQLLIKRSKIDVKIILRESSDASQYELFQRLNTGGSHELSTILLQLEKSDFKVQVVMIRSGVCLLYAHWEGFVKAAAQRYLEYVANLRLRYRELQRNFLVVDLRRQIRRFANQRNTDQAKELVDKVLDGERRFSTNNIEPIDTRSNLNSKGFMDILNLVGINASEYVSKEKLLDIRLVNNRNNVAHGRQFEMTFDDYTELHNAIVELIDRFRDDLENAAEKKSYRVEVARSG